MTALRTAAVLSALVLGTGLVACGGGDDSSDAASTTSAASSQADNSTTTTLEDLRLPEGATMVADVTMSRDGNDVTSRISSDSPYACTYGDVTDTEWKVSYVPGDPIDHLETLSGPEISSLDVTFDLP